MTTDVKQLLVGGPKLISGTIDAVSGDTSATIDLTTVANGPIQNILNLVNIQGFLAAAGHAIATVDFTTTAGTLTVTFADPLANLTIYFTVLGR